MYLLRVSRLKDQTKLNMLFDTLLTTRLRGATTIIYEPPLDSEIKQVIRANSFDYVILDMGELLSANEDTRQDFIMDLIECGCNVFIKPSASMSESQLQELSDEFELFGLTYRWMVPFDNNLTIDLTKPDLNAINTCLEILNVPTHSKPYSAVDFACRILVTEDGHICKEQCTISEEISRESILRALSLRDIDIKTVCQLAGRLPEGELLSVNMYEPWVFLSNDPDINTKILDYKYRVFDKLKNIDPEDYPMYPPQLIDIFNSIGYIKLDDIIEILYS